MACLSDIARIRSSIGILGLVKRVWHEVQEDNHFTWAAALAYSWLFAVFPFLIFLLTLLPYLPRRLKDGAADALHDLVSTLPPQASQTIWENIQANLHTLLEQRQGKVFPRLVGLALSLWAASGGMNMTIAALDKCFELDRGRPFYRQRPVAIGLTLVVALLMMMVVSLLPVGTLLKKWAIREAAIATHDPWLILFDVARWTLSIIVLLAALALVYHFGPGVRRRFRWVTPGAVFCIVTWIALGMGFRLYLTRFADYGKTYGAVGGVVVLLLFFYADALVLLIGAEINSEIDFEVLKVRRGSNDFRTAEDAAARLAQAAAAISPSQDSVV